MRWQGVTTAAEGQIGSCFPSDWHTLNGSSAPVRSQEQQYFRTSAIATAIAASVTVSIGEDTSGVRRLMFRVTLLVRSTSWAPK